MWHQPQDATAHFSLEAVHHGEHSQEYGNREYQPQDRQA
jgi:hypothetical protein